jgi:hypothetical protein
MQNLFLAMPDIALQNGGGIRNDSVIPADDITELDTFDMLPFSNFERPGEYPAVSVQGDHGERRVE